MDPLTISSIATAGAGLVQGITGLFQKGKAKRMARANKRPTYKIQQGILDNQDLVESRASQGMSDASRQVQQQGAERGLNRSIDAILAAGGSANNIAELYGNYSDGMSKMALLDEEMRAQNIRNLIAQNNQMAAEEDKAWQVNVYGPYADQAQAAAALSNQGTNNLWKGINSTIGAGTSWATGQLYKNEANNVYGTNGNLGNNATGATPGASPVFIPPTAASAAPYNWNTYNQPAPVIPQNPTQQANAQIQEQYPGLLLGGGSFDMSLFNDLFTD